MLAAATGEIGRRLRAARDVEAARDRVATSLGEVAAPALPADVESFDRQVPGISPLVTPNDKFYRVDTRILVPQVEPDGWSLRITGMVRREVELSFDDLLAMDRIDEYVTLSCVSNEVGGALVGNALVVRRPSRRPARPGGPRPAASQIVGRSVDGWTAGFPTDVATDGRPSMVAVAMNGEPLPVKHGFPARLIVPGLYGYVSATKWLSEIELTTWDAVDGYWIPRGWAKEGPIRTQSRIDVPRPGASVHAGPTPIAGVAWAPTRAIGRVEVRIDDGRLAAHPPVGRALGEHLGAVAPRLGRDAGPPPDRGACHRRHGRHPDRRGRAAAAVGCDRAPHDQRRGHVIPRTGGDALGAGSGRAPGTLARVGQPASVPPPAPRGHVLVVDDEPMVREVITAYLERDGFRVTGVSDGAAALRWLAVGRPDLVVLDLMLPAVDGLSVLAQLRRTAAGPPVIVVTARGEEPDRVLGLELGADDYVVKPLSPRELVARVNSVLRRARPTAATRVVHGSLVIDGPSREVTIDGRLVPLTAREFDLLAFLAAAPRQVFSRAELLDRVWQSSADYQDPSTVTVHIRRLRHKIETDPDQPRHLVNVWGVGYRFDP